jgi:nifR3 family TIM-barrel protein
VAVIGNIPLAAPVLIAPMSGVTDAPFRRAALDFGAPAIVTEMVAGEMLAAGDAEALRRARRAEGGLFIVQLVGRDPAVMAAAARRLAAEGAAVIDLNMGCPARRVTTGACGAALMREPDLARAIVAAVVAAAPAPVTVKMRLGWDDASLNAAQLAQSAVTEGACAVTVHARTRAQFYAGEARWERVAEAVRAVDVPVIVNGDIRDPATSRAALKASGAAGVMVGRAAIGRPWLAAEIAAALAGRAYARPSAELRLASLGRQVTDSVELYGERQGVRVVRKHVAAALDAWTADGLGEIGREARAAICRIEEAAELLRALDRLAAPSARLAA